MPHYILYYLSLMAYVAVGLGVCALIAHFWCKWGVEEWDD